MWPQFPGAVVLSLSRSRMFRRPKTGWMPNELLNEGVGSEEKRVESRSILKSCQAVEVPPYDRREMEQCLHYYADRRWVNRGRCGHCSLPLAISLSLCSGLVSTVHTIRKKTCSDKVSVQTDSWSDMSCN